MSFRILPRLFILLCVHSTAFAQIVPSPIDPANIENSPYVYTGLIESDDGYIGSGSVAVHPKLVLGCAHMNYGDNGAWLPARSLRWFWKWNQDSYPVDSSTGMMLTGYYYFSQYQKNVRWFGMDAPWTFQFDFVANYSATQDTAGGYAGKWVKDGEQSLTTGGSNKLISGYPSGRYNEGDPNEYRMHATEFSKDMYKDTGNYLGLDGVETGSGNSGGPVWVWKNEEWAFAGVLVSGAESKTSQWSTIGVCSLNKQGWGLITSALRKTGTPGSLLKQTVSAENVPAPIPDQSSISGKFSVSGLVGVIQGIKFSLATTHQRAGDLIVTLRSPSGKTVTITKAVAPSKSSKPNLVLIAKKVNGFSGLDANGTWTVGVRDAYANNIGILESASMEITTQ